MMGRDMTSGFDAAYTTDRVSFTAMSGDATIAIMGRIARHAERNEGYPLNLNATDAKNLVETLANFVELDSRYEGEHPLSEWAQSFLSSIGEMLNVEMI
jgi:hypothetical protein